MSRSKKRVAVDPETRELNYVSPSAIKTFLDCPRKWWMTYVLGLRSPATEANIFGSDLHADVEEYELGLKDAPDSELGRIALHEGYLPRPGDGWEIEVETGREPALAGVRLLGYVDARLGGSFFVTILDHKTMRTRDYAETSETITRNLQLILYAWDYLRTRPEMTTAELMHVQYVRSESRVYRVVGKVTREDVMAYVEDLGVPVVEQMKEIARIEKLEDVPKDLGGCQKYGGCYMLTQGCSGRNDRAVPSLRPTGAKPLSFLKNLKAKKAAAEAAASSTPTAPAYPPADAVSPPDAEPDSYVPMIDREATLLKGVTAARLEKWGIKTVGDLKTIAEAGTLGDLKGVGPKLTADLVEALKGVGMYEEPSSVVVEIGSEPIRDVVVDKAPTHVTVVKPASVARWVYVDCGPLAPLDDLGAELAKLDDHVVATFNDPDDLKYRRSALVREAFVAAVPRLRSLSSAWYLSGDDPNGRRVGETLLGTLGTVVKTRGR